MAGYEGQEHKAYATGVERYESGKPAPTHGIAREGWMAAKCLETGEGIAAKCRNVGMVDEDGRNLKRLSGCEGRLFTIPEGETCPRCGGAVEEVEE